MTTLNLIISGELDNSNARFAWEVVGRKAFWEINGNYFQSNLYHVSQPSLEDYWSVPIIITPTSSELILLTNPNGWMILGSEKVNENASRPVVLYQTEGPLNEKLVNAQYLYIPNVSLYTGGDRIERLKLRSINRQYIDRIFKIAERAGYLLHEFPNLQPGSIVSKYEYVPEEPIDYRTMTNLPESLILNGLRVNFVPFEEITQMLQNRQIARYDIDPLLQSIGSLNKIFTMYGTNGMIYLTKGQYDQVSNKIYPPV